MGGRGRAPQLRAGLASGAVCEIRCRIHMGSRKPQKRSV